MPYKDPEKRKAYAKEYRQNNTQKLRKLSDEWRKENEEKVKESNRKAGRAYYNRNRERLVKEAGIRNSTKEWIAYRKAWYESNREVILEKAKKRWREDESLRKRRIAYQASRRVALREVITEIKENLGCCNCEENDPRCLDFHHRNPLEKTNGISRMVNCHMSLDTILEELEKCDVICSNCHRKLHFGEGRNQYA